MSATIIDGKAIAAEIKTEIAAEVQQMRDKGHRAPHLAAVLVGHDGGSETYVKNKVLACEACGFDLLSSATKTLSRNSNCWNVFV